MQTGLGIRCGSNVPRPVFHPQLAPYFRSLRERRGWGQNQASDLALRKGLSLLTRQVLLRLENGKTKWPDPGVLQQLATLYDLPYAELVAEVVRHTYGLAFTVENERTLELKADDDTPIEEFVSVRLLEDPIAAGPPLIINESEIAGHRVFPRRTLDRLGVTRPLCVRVGRRQKSMAGTIDAGDIVLLDCSDERRQVPRRDRIYAVNLDDEGATLKRVIPTTTSILLVADNPDKERYPTREVTLDEDQSLLDVIIGEVIWWGQSL
jgi:transcriptional regulator with XRE-family HTH domain